MPPPPDPEGAADSAPARQRLFAALTALLVVVCVLLIVESGLQLREYLRRKEVHRLWATPHAGFRIHPFLQVSPLPDPRPDRNVNAHGFRGGALAEVRRPDSLRVFALGGSTTWSASLPFDDTWPAQLEQRLRERLPGRVVEVQNAACDWYSSEHSLIRYLFEVRRFRPDVVLVFHAVNDLYRGFAPEWFSVGPFDAGYAHYLGPLIRAERTRELATWFPFQESLVWRWMSAGGDGRGSSFEPHRFDPFQPGALRVLRTSLRPAPVEAFPSLPVFRENLRLLARQLESDGVRLFLGTQPSLYRGELGEAERRRLVFAPLFAAQDGRYPDPESMRRGMAAYNAATAEVAREASVPLVDLAARIPSTLENFSDDVHMTPQALARVAEEFEKALDAAGALAPPSEHAAPR